MICDDNLITTRFLMSSTFNNVLPNGDFCFIVVIETCDVFGGRIFTSVHGFTNNVSNDYCIRQRTFLSR